MNAQRNCGYNLPGPVRHVTRRFAVDINGLTAVQRDTLMRLATDLTYAQMAETLGIPRDAMKGRVGMTFKALGVNSRTDALARAREIGALPEVAS